MFLSLELVEFLQTNLCNSPAPDFPSLSYALGAIIQRYGARLITSREIERLPCQRRIVTGDSRCQAENTYHLIWNQADGILLQVLIYGPKPPKSEHVDYQIPGAAPGNANVKPVRHSLSRRPSATTGNMDKENRVPNGEYYSVMNSGNNHYHEDSDSDSLSQEGDSKNHCVVDELPSGRSSAAPSRGPTPRGQRTVALHNLPNWVTHQQITEGIRGGALLHIFLRGREHIVNVSFVEEEAAQEFLTYAKCHGVCIAGKRVCPFSHVY